MPSTHQAHYQDLPLRHAEFASQERLQLLARAADLLANGTDYEKTLDFVASLLVSSLAIWCTIDLVNDAGKIERVSVAHRDLKKAQSAEEIRRRYPASPKAKCGVYRVIETKLPVLKPVLTKEDWAKRADDPHHLELIMALGSSSYMCLPLIAQGRVVGAVILMSNERVYTEDDLETAQELARLIAMAVDNVRMFRKMRATLGELEQTNHQLIQSSKMAVLGVISAGIAHEINNPLTVIRYYLAHIESLFAKGMPPSRWEFYSFAEKMNRSIDRIVKIVNNVKEFSRESERRYEHLDLRSVLALATGLLDESFVLKRIRVEKWWPEKEIPVIGDAKRLEQVLVNVLSNAKDAIVARHQIGGVVTVQVSMTND
ncbi:MAG: GAF domain-containing protein, partial [Bdellovibrionota bacterium]